jgi:hypothetical protein
MRSSSVIGFPASPSRPAARVDIRPPRTRATARPPAPRSTTLTRRPRVVVVDVVVDDIIAARIVTVILAFATEPEPDASTNRWLKD